MDVIYYAIVGVVCAIIAGFAAFKFGYSYRIKVAEAKINNAEEEAKKIIENA